MHVVFNAIAEYLLVCLAFVAWVCNAISLMLFAATNYCSWLDVFVVFVVVVVVVVAALLLRREALFLRRCVNEMYACSLSAHYFEQFNIIFD